MHVFAPKHNDNTKHCQGDATRQLTLLKGLPLRELSGGELPPSDTLCIRVLWGNHPGLGFRVPILDTACSVAKMQGLFLGLVTVFVRGVHAIEVLDP